MPRPEIVKVADKTKTRSRGKILHPKVEVEETTETFRAAMQGGNGPREDTVPPQALDREGQRLQLCLQF